MALLSTCDPVAHSDQDEFQVRGRKQNQAAVPVSCGDVSDVLVTATLSSSTAAQLGSSLRHGSPDLAEPLSLVLNWIESVDSSSPILERDRARGFFREKPATPRGRSSTSKLDSQSYSKAAQDCSDINSIMPDSQSYSEPAKACAATSIHCLNGGLACHDLNDLPELISPRPKTPRDEFNERQQINGTVCYHVHYSEHMRIRPWEDILKLRIDEDNRVFVSDMLGDGPAAQTGVSLGDEIVSINGETPSECFASKQGGFKHVSNPATLLFMGFVGKFPAEVKLKHADRTYNASGLATHNQIFGSSEVTLLDEVIFRPAEATLLLATGPSNIEGLRPRLYELRPAEAKLLLHAVKCRVALHSHIPELQPAQPPYTPQLAQPSQPTPSGNDLLSTEFLTQAIESFHAAGLSPVDLVPKENQESDVDSIDAQMYNMSSSL